jgi:calcineurin-like phosphoesterase family protein
MTTFFTSDTHFGHGGALGLYRRPFASVAAMNEALLERWNATVGREDEVWHLGDFAIRQSAERMAGILHRLAGTKHLVRGNNDPDETVALPGWASVVERAELVVDGVALVLAHHPLDVWPAGALNLHGHSHGRRKARPMQLDVGVDCWDYRPVGWERIAAAVRRDRAAV